LIYKEKTVLSLLLSSLITLATGGLLSKCCYLKRDISYKEGFAIVTFAWVAASLFGSLPYIFTGCLPSFADALFETVSGFTTTGATVIADVEALPKGLLFWRSLTQWLGGMGIIALFVAIIAGMGARANQIFRSELPGPSKDKVTPRVRETAKALWKTYVVLSLVLLVLLYLLGMNLFDAFCHTFTTMASGGFSTRNNSIMAYNSAAIQWVIILFMFLAGTNISLHYLFFKYRKVEYYKRDNEFVLYVSVIVLASLGITWALNQNNGLGWGQNLRDAIFQVVSIGTTTGFVTADYDRWPTLAKAILLLLMFSGACAGSTSGNIKLGRYLMMLRRTWVELKQMVHPRAVIPVRYSSKVIGDELLMHVFAFFFVWILLILISTLMLCATGLRLDSSLFASVACIGNVGPGFGLVGPAMNYGFLSDVGKYLLSILMLVGRLEIYPVLVLFVPEYWKE